MNYSPKNTAFSNSTANHLQFHKTANHSVSVVCKLTKVTFQIKQLNLAFKLWQILNSWCHL